MIIRKVIFVLLISCSVVQAQETSNLFQVLTASNLIERPKVFRDLQVVLSANLKEDIQGVQFNLLHDKVDEYKKLVLSFVSPIHLELDSRIFQIQYLSKIDTIKVKNDKFFNETVIQNIDTLKSGIKTNLNNLLNRITGTSEADTLISFLVYAGVNNLTKKKDIEYEDNFNYNVKIAEVVLNEIRSKLIDLFLVHFPEDDSSTVRTLIQERLIPTLNATIESTVISLRENIVSVFNQVHQAITNEIEIPLSNKLKGISGLSFSEGQGEFSGGIMLQLQNVSGNLHLAFYANGNLSMTTGDSIAHSLVGLQLSYTGKSLQLDLLASIYFGDKEFEFAKVYEVGGGLSLRFKGGETVGLAGFYFLNYESGKKESFTLGASLKISKADPALIVGIRTASGFKAKPIIQISYPIN